jgi:hypothetical protein
MIRNTSQEPSQVSADGRKKPHLSVTKSISCVQDGLESGGGGELRSKQTILTVVDTANQL